MCLLLIALHVHPRFPLIVAANRDEFLARPTLPADFWSDRPEILAGRDQSAGGTWMGVTRSGRFAAVTNYRDLHRPRPAEPSSRGQLVLEALSGDPDTQHPYRYDGFNLLWGDTDRLMYHNNISGTVETVPSGIHGLSNHMLNTPWPKVIRAKRAFTDAITAGVPATEVLFGLLQDRTIAPDDQLPDTGLDLQRERALSAPFIETPGYGTRCSTVILFGIDGTIAFEERTWPAGTVVQRSFVKNADH
jgi:uncharacterized protein with NRDE domain